MKKEKESYGFLTRADQEIADLREFFGLKPLKVEKRKCLRCKTEFISEGVRNRLCVGCRSFVFSVDDSYF